jgi:hypothetical protein
MRDWVVEKNERQLVEDAYAVSARICRCMHRQALEGPDCAGKQARHRMWLVLRSWHQHRQRQQQHTNSDTQLPITFPGAQKLQDLWLSC